MCGIWKKYPMGDIHRMWFDYLLLNQYMYVDGEISCIFFYLIFFNFIDVHWKIVENLPNRAKINPYTV